MTGIGVDPGGMTQSPTSSPAAQVSSVCVRYSCLCYLDLIWMRFCSNWFAWELFENKFFVFLLYSFMPVGCENMTSLQRNAPFTTRVSVAHNHPQVMFVLWSVVAIYDKYWGFKTCCDSKKRTLTRNFSMFSFVPGWLILFFRVKEKKNYLQRMSFIACISFTDFTRSSCAILLTHFSAHSFP